MCGDVRLELRTGALLDIGEHSLRFPCITIRTLRAQRIVDIADMHEVARLVAGTGIVPRRITLSVDHDVVLLRDCRRQIRLSTALDYQPRSGAPVLLHYLPPLLRQPSRLVQN